MPGLEARWGGIVLLACGAAVAAVAPGTAPARARGPLPNLVVTALSVPRTAVVGTAITLRATVRNAGTGSSRSSKTRFYLSVDRKVDAGDYVLSPTVTVGSLRKGARRSAVLRLALPPRAPSGRRYLIACADALRKVREVKERDNCRASKTVIVISGGTVTPSPLPRGTATGFADATAFLYRGPNATQTGVTATIDPARVAVIRGRATNRDGQPIGGVRVTVLGRPDLGQTTSRADGGFELAVEGGGAVVVDLSKAGYLPAQREARTAWHDYEPLPDAILVPVDAAVSTVQRASPDWQTHRATASVDADGTRRPTLLFAPGTVATIHLPGGGTATPASFHVRATEYTTGTSGQGAMPGDLPAQSGYTFAVEYSLDEAIAQGASGVTFDRPVLAYGEDFLGFPVGQHVPAGSYDRAHGRWVAETDGRVIEVLSADYGTATIDADGDGQPDTSPQLAALGVTTGELVQLATLYPAGTVLWRVPLRHFSPDDYNWPVGPPSDAVAAKDGPASDTPCPVCGAPGSQIQVERQTLGERVAIPGTPYALVYASDRVPGRAAARAFSIRLTRSTVPPSLTGVDMEVQIAGRSFATQYAPTPDTVATFSWDGRDAFGRLLQGWQTATVRVGFTYDGQYYATAAEKDAAFGRFSGLDFTPGPGHPVAARRPRASGTITIRARIPVTIWREWKIRLGAWDARGQGLGGWTLDAQHAYDADARLLLRGDGAQVSADVAAVTGIDAFAGSGAAGSSGDGGPASEAAVYAPRGVATAADGSVYIATPYGVRRVAPDGTISTVYAPTGSRPTDVAVGPDGKVYIADTYLFGVFCYDPVTATTVRIAGTGQQGFSGDGGPATAAMLQGIFHLAVGPDGTVYVMTVGVDVVGQGIVARVRAIAPDGTIDTAVGGGAAPVIGNPRQDGLPASQVRVGSVTNALAVGPDGSVYLSDFDGAFFIRRIGPDGKSSVFAGNPASGPTGDGGPATDARFRTIEALAVSADGALYVGDYGVVRRIDVDGTISSIAGDGSTAAPSGDTGPARAAAIGRVGGLALGPDGALLIADYTSARVRAVRAVLPGSSNTDTILPNAEGSEVYRFDRTGRHLVTYDGLGGAAKAMFAYDGAGRLTSITDQDGLVTRVEHDGQGTPTAIVAPTGQRTVLAVDANGFLSQITVPGGGTTTLASSADGLLTSFTDPNGQAHSAVYDALGRLTADTDPTGATTGLARTTLPDGWEVERTTPTGLHLRYRIEQAADGTLHHIVTQASGAVTAMASTPDGKTVVTTPEGRTITIEQRPDPRFGLEAPITTSLTVHEPSGLEKVTTRTATVDLVQSANPFSIRTLTETATVNGRVSTATYTGATRTMVATSPAGRTRSWTWDTRGHLVRFEPSGATDAVVTTWDGRGRMQTRSQGDRSTTFAYDARDRPTAVTDATGRVVHYAYDQADRVTSQTTPGGTTVAYSYDAAGNTTGVTLPGGATHAMTFDEIGQLTGYTAPGAGAQTYASDGDRRPTSLTLPGGATITLTYDSAGRATGSTAPGNTDSVSYTGSSQQPDAATRTRGSDVQATAFTFDGDLATRLDVSGPATGDITRTFGTDLDLTGWAIDGTASGITRDADRLATSDGAWTLTRDAATGLATSESDGSGTVATTYDAVGRISLRTVTVGSTQIGRIAWTYDAADRVATRTDTPGPVGTAVETRSYSYDADGHLTGVSGASSEAYTYDSHGNRTLGPGGSATFDLQDRLTAVASEAWTSNAGGTVTGHGGVSLDYGARGDLVAATIGAASVAYAYDVLGRRAARTVDAATTQYLYATPETPFVVTASKAAGATTIYRYDDADRLVALERAGTRYVVVSDQVGSPLAVANATTGAVVLRRTYDAFGRVTAQSGTFDLPIGFAGGLDDPLTGLVRFGQRDYDPATGRFLARDPALFAGGQWNLYTYNDSDPVGARDPSGLGVRVCHAGGGGFTPNYKPVSHWWIETSTKSLGIGAGGSLGIGNVEWTDQTYKWKLYGKNSIECDDQKDIDEACVNRAIYAGKQEGLYVPGANDCQTNVTAVLETCRSTPIKPR